VRIGIDMLSIQANATRDREVSAHVRLLVAGLLESPADHQFVLYAHEGLPFDLIPSVEHASLSIVRRGATTITQRLEQIAAANPDELDWLLIPSPFDPNYEMGPPARPLNGPRMAAVVHDLGPVLFPDRAPAEPGFSGRAARALTRIRPYDLLLAASETTRSDSLVLLGLPPDRVTTIGAAADEKSFAPDVTVPRSLGARRELHRLGVRRAFVLFDARGDGPSGVGRRLEAFGRLPDAFRSVYQLVLFGLSGEDQVQRVRALASARGWTDAAVLAEPLDETSSRVLFQQCAALVAPRRYDGHGMTVLEAMQCGAVVIAGNTSAPAELLGAAGFLVDPIDPREIANGLAQVLDDWTLAQTLRSRAIECAHRHTPGQVGARAREAIECATRPRSTVRLRLDRPHSLKPRIAVFAPLPPRDSGVGDYAARLIDTLKSSYTIDVYHEQGYVPDRALSAHDLAYHDARLFDRHDAIIDYHAVIYQMGNGVVDHSRFFDQLADRPGLVTLHDLFLSAYPYPNAESRAEILDAYRRAIVEYSPERASEFLPHLEDWCEEEGGLSAACARRGLFLNRRVFEHAQVVVVHSSWCLEQVRVWLPEHVDKTAVIPMGAVPTTRTPDERAAIRDRFALGREALVLASFGLVARERMIVEVLEAFGPVAELDASAVLLVVGEEVDDGEARRQALELGLADCVRFLGRQTAAGYADLLAVTDLGINLRRPPSNGETSASLLDLLAAGVPALVTDFGSFNEYPDQVVRKVPWSREGSEGLRRELLALAADREARAVLKNKSLAYIHTYHDWTSSAGLYRELIERCAASRRPGAVHRSTPGCRPHCWNPAKESR
jgi:glycosyltransferase involved in cell wall biosynthesis